MRNFGILIVIFASIVCFGVVFGIITRPYFFRLSSPLLLDGKVYENPDPEILVRYNEWILDNIQHSKEKGDTRTYQVLLDLYEEVERDVMIAGFKSVLCGTILGSIIGVLTIYIYRRRRRTLWLIRQLPTSRAS